MPEAAGNHGLNKSQFNGFVQCLEDEQADIDGRMADAKADCDKNREQIKAIYAEAKEAGIDVKELRRLIRHRRAKKKMEAERTDKLTMYEQVMGMLD